VQKDKAFIMKLLLVSTLLSSASTLASYFAPWEIWTITRMFDDKPTSYAYLSVYEVLEYTPNFPLLGILGGFLPVLEWWLMKRGRFSSFLPLNLFSLILVATPVMCYTLEYRRIRVELMILEQRILTPSWGYFLAVGGSLLLLIALICSIRLLPKKKTPRFVGHERVFCGFLMLLGSWLPWTISFYTEMTWGLWADVGLREAGLAVSLLGVAVIALASLEGRVDQQALWATLLTLGVTELLFTTNFILTYNMRLRYGTSYGAFVCFFGSAFLIGSIITEWVRRRREGWLQPMPAEQT